MKVNQYVLIVDILFRRNFDGILLRCVDENQAPTLIKEFHEGICGGHFAPTATAHKIIRERFYWSSIFRDSYACNKEMFFMPTVLRKNEESCDASATDCGGTTIFPMGT
jgi:hypothetical protein